MRKIAAFWAGFAAFTMTACGEAQQTETTAATPPAAPVSEAVPAAETPVATTTPAASGAATFAARIREQPPLGLPPVPVPADNPMTAEKVRLGEVLFNDTRFSRTGTVACATCHKAERAFTDSPLHVSVGIEDLTGTRNAPTVLNAAYLRSQFWDGRRDTLENQSLDPFLNPVEMALPSHDPILEIVRTDPAYGEMFEAAFGKSGDAITMTEVTQAIASFERTAISGDSPFDRWYFGGEEDAISDAAKRGFEVFLNDGRCVSCHTVSETHALFTDNKFHNLGIGFSNIADTLDSVAGGFIAAERTESEVDEAVLADPNISELGRFVVTRQYQDIGQFKTPTLRNIAATAPYMHDGSHATLEEVVTFYNNALSTDEVEAGGTPNPFQSGGIRPLNLTDEQMADLVEFMKTLTSPEFEAAAQLALSGQ